GPQRVLAGGGSRRIEEALLRDEDERPLRVAAPPDLGLRRRDFGQGTAEVHGARAGAVRRPPRYGSVEGGVDLEDAGTVAVAFEPAAITHGQTVARDGEELPRGHVEEGRAGRRQ